MISHDAIGHCRYCPRLCRSACPVETASGREALTPRAKMVMAAAIDEQQAPAEAAEVLWGCSDCGACEAMCLHDNPVGETLYSARSRVAELPEGIRGARQRFELHANPHGRSLTAEQPRVADRPVQRAPLLLFGCHALASEPSLAKKALQLAQRLHPDVQVPTLLRSSGEETLCCGRVLQEAGAVRAFERHRAALAERLASADEVWVLEATCLDAFSAAAPSHLPVRLLAEVLAASALKPQQRPQSIVVHTGCGTHRHARAEEAIVQLAQRASDDVRIPPADLPFAGCCGGRGGIVEVMPEVAAEMAAGRREELRAMEGEVTVSFSSCCNGRLGLRHVLDLYAPTADPAT